MSAEKLFDFRTVDGPINIGAIDTLRALEKKFSPFPSFVGLALRGSTFRGYSTQSSDIDLVLLYDSEHPRMFIRDNKTFDLMTLAGSIYVETSMSADFRVATVGAQDINPKYVIGPDNLPDTRRIVDIFRLVIGPKIAQYRRLYSELIRSLPKSKIDQIIGELARELMVDDALGWHKMAERVSGVPMSDYKGEIDLYHEVLKANGVASYDVYRGQRYGLWKARIKRLLLVGEDQLEEVAKGV